jgi:hypothetical protein
MKHYQHNWTGGASLGSSSFNFPASLPSVYHKLPTTVSSLLHSIHALTLSKHTTCTRAETLNTAEELGRERAVAAADRCIPAHAPQFFLKPCYRLLCSV